MLPSTVVAGRARPRPYRPLREHGGPRAPIAASVGPAGRPARRLAARALHARLDRRRHRVPARARRRRDLRLTADTESPPSGSSHSTSSSGRRLLRAVGAAPVAGRTGARDRARRRSPSMASARPASRSSPSPCTARPGRAAVAALYLAAVPIYTALRPGDENFWLRPLGVFFIVLLIAWGMFVRARRQLVHSPARPRPARRGRAAAAGRAGPASRARPHRARDARRARAPDLAAQPPRRRAGVPARRAPDEVARAAGVIRGSAHQALDDLREVIGVLREDAGRRRAGAPAADDRRPRHADRRSRAAGGHARARATSRRPMAVPTSVGRNAYRVVQEGSPTRASTRRLRRGRGGRRRAGRRRHDRGPQPAARRRGCAAEIPGAGTGLVGLTERVALAGGRLEHGPREGECRLWAWLPWPAS